MTGFGVPTTLEFAQRAPTAPAQQTSTRAQLGGLAIKRFLSAHGEFDKAEGRLADRTRPREYTYALSASQFVGVALDSLHFIAAAADH